MTQPIRELPALDPSEHKLLKELLFGERISRNKAFDRFEDPSYKRVHRIARMLRAVHQQLHRPAFEHWREDLEDGRICLRLHDPKVGIMRAILLTPALWDLLHAPEWTQGTS